mmetsp:Transcript_42739/g.133382  ORF Transcript_42739/g.133382 Transcript_42739/m.133382 type:complete len:268 (+) Transcript_42739:660-1463(+)
MPRSRARGLRPCLLGGWGRAELAPPGGLQRSQRVRGPPRPAPPPHRPRRRLPAPRHAGRGRHGGGGARVLGLPRADCAPAAVGRAPGAGVRALPARGLRRPRAHAPAAEVSGPPLPATAGAAATLAEAPTGTGAAAGGRLGVVAGDAEPARRGSSAATRLRWSARGEWCEWGRAADGPLEHDARGDGHQLHAPQSALPADQGAIRGEPAGGPHHEHRRSLLAASGSAGHQQPVRGRRHLVLDCQAGSAVRRLWRESTGYLYRESRQP